MPDIHPTQEDSIAPRLVEGRSCGSCNVCCVALTIDDPDMQKVQAIAAAI